MTSSRKNAARSALAPLDERQRYAMEESAQYLRVSRQYLYLKAARGELRIIKDGQRSFVPGTEIARLSRVES